MEINKKDLEQQVFQQHKNDKEDIIQIIEEYFAEITSSNACLARECTYLIKEGEYVHGFNQWKYDRLVKIPSMDEIKLRISKMKQRKPINNNGKINQG